MPKGEGNGKFDGGPWALPTFLLASAEAVSADSYYSSIVVCLISSLTL